MRGAERFTNESIPPLSGNPPLNQNTSSTLLSPNPIYTQDMVQPKVIAGKQFHGRDMAVLLEKLVEALNSQEIPNVASMLEVFNKDLVGRCSALCG